MLVGIAMFALSGGAAADPPSRAARLGYVSGAVSFSPAGENDWVRATLNRPLTTGDRLWADFDSRAEVQVGGAALRIGARTNLTLLNLDDSIVQVQLSQGTLKLRVRGLGPGEAFEIDTPNLAFTLRRPGDYRVEVDAARDATIVTVQGGQGEVYGEGASYVVESGTGYRFAGTGLRDYQRVDARRVDDFDRWAGERDRRSENSASARYVSSDVVGYEDLDADGIWRTDPDYGNVWVPNRVAAGWTPYRDGHWAWVNPWGWTWVDKAPWGFAVSHYGRWANLRGTWVWVPGPRIARAVYAPALVVFVGGGNFQLSISPGIGAAVGWFPLAPRDVYRPSYAASRGYFDRINRSNTSINTTTITNVYNITNVTNIVYANRQVRGAIVAVPATAFVHAQPVAKVAVAVSNQAIASAPVAVGAAVAPVRQSVHGPAAPGARPPAPEHAIVTRNPPPAAPQAGGVAAAQAKPPTAALPRAPSSTPPGPSAVEAQPPQRARPEPPVQAFARPAPPLVTPLQVRAPPVAAAPVLPPAPIVQAPPPRPLPPPAAQPPARKPAPEAAKPTEQKRAEEDAQKRRP